MGAALQLNLIDPHHPDCTHEKQARVLDWFDGCEDRHKSDGGIQYINYVGGRGCGKTTVALIVLFRIAMKYGNQRTFWSARTNGEIDNVLLTRNT